MDFSYLGTQGNKYKELFNSITLKVPAHVILIENFYEHSPALLKQGHVWASIGFRDHRTVLCMLSYSVCSKYGQYSS